MIDTQTIDGQADLPALRTEIDTDPAGLGLDTIEANDAENADKLNNSPVAPATTVRLRVATVTTQDVFDACDQFERQALTTQQYRDFETIISFGQLFPANAAQTIGTLRSLFGPTTKSAAALEALLYKDGSRAEQMRQDGLLKTVSYITPSDYANARQLTQ